MSDVLILFSAAIESKSKGLRSSSIGHWKGAGGVRFGFGLGDFLNCLMPEYVLPRKAITQLECYKKKYLYWIRINERQGYLYNMV